MVQPAVGACPFDSHRDLVSGSQSGWAPGITEELSKNSVPTLG